VLISFIGGVLLFREGNIRQKMVPFMGIIIGLILIMV
jgi:glucose uptake protein GlcU